MKILVDKMPKTIEECRYSIPSFDKEYYVEYYRCSKESIVCENVSKCPFFKEYDPYEIPESLGFSLRKAVAYAKGHNMEVRDIPKEILEELR